MKNIEIFKEYFFWGLGMQFSIFLILIAIVGVIFLVFLIKVKVDTNKRLKKKNNKSKK